MAFEKFRNPMTWWKILLTAIAMGVGYAAFVSAKWGDFQQWAGGDQPAEFTEKDVLPCQVGTHQEDGKCVSNPTGKSGAPPSAPSAAAPTSGMSQ